MRDLYLDLDLYLHLERGIGIGRMSVPPSSLNLFLDIDSHRIVVIIRSSPLVVGGMWCCKMPSGKSKLNYSPGRTINRNIILE